MRHVAFFGEVDKRLPTTMYTLPDVSVNQFCWPFWPLHSEIVEIFVHARGHLQLYLSCSFAGSPELHYFFPLALFLRGRALALACL